jgi:TRAP-type C4-dicarboxylate transport system permease small subunit
MNFFEQTLRRLVLLSAGLAGASLVAMMVVTCADVVLRRFGHPVPGTYDLVKIAAVLVIACGLPYTTAVKGHVAVEFFFQRMGRRGRVVADTMIRLLIMALFSVLAWRLVLHGVTLRRSGEASMTLQVPIFWVPHVMAFACALVVLVTLYHVLHPGKRLLEP